MKYALSDDEFIEIISRYIEDTLQIGVFDAIYPVHRRYSYVGVIYKPKGELIV